MAGKEKSSKLEITPRAGGADKTLVISGDFPNLHDDPDKIHRLLDLLKMPKGTEVRVVTQAASVIVR
jgi:hypothetical protein